MTRTVVLGAGFGGLTAATELAARLPRGHDVLLVDRREAFLMGLAKLWILDGRRAPGEGERRLRDVARHGVDVVTGEVSGLDVAARTVRVGAETLPWDHLVVALGADLRPAGLPGAAEAGRNLYAASGVADLARDLAAFRGGDVLVVVASVPFKCPPAPYEAGMLIATHLAARGVEANVTVCSPEPQPLPVAGPECGGLVKEWAAERGVDVVNGAKALGVDADRKVVRFEDGTERAFDLLAYVPPHAAPQVLRDAGLVGEAGWVPADAGTLATRFPDAWAVGDANVVKLPNGKPLVKAGVMAEGEARVVAENLASRLRGGAETARFDGKGGCFLETGGGEAVEIAGDFYATPNPVVAATGPPSPKALEKKRAFEAERLARWFGAPSAPRQA